MSATEVFETLVVIRAIDAFTAPARRMAEQMGLVGAQAEALQKKLAGFRNMAMIGGALTMAGVGLAKVMESGLDQAGQFLTKMTMIKDVTGATADQMKRIQDTIQLSSGKTIFGVQDTASFAQQLATSGLTADQTSGLLPLFTQFAEVQKLGKGMDPTTAILEAIQGAHAVGAYDPTQLSSFLNQYNKASFMTPGSTTELADTFKYLAPKGAGIGMSTEDMLTTSALANRMGLAGSMGGTNAADMILRAIPGLFKGKAQPAALKELGINAYDDTGKFKGITEFITELQGAAEKVPNMADRAKLFHAAFGQQGMGFANLLATPRGMEQLTALVNQMNGVKPITEMQHDINQTPEGQRLQLTTNIDNLKLDVWLELAKILNPMFHDLNDIVSKMQEFSKAHPEIAKITAELLAFTTAVLLTVGPIVLLTGVIGYLSTAKMFSQGFNLLGLAIKGASGPVLGLIAAGYLLYQAWTNDWGGIREKTKAVTDWLAQEIPKAVKNIKDFAKDLGLISQDGKFEMPAWLKYLLIGLASARVAVNILKLAQIAYNLVCDANPWLAAIAAMSIAVLLLASNWDKVTASYQKAKDAMGKTAAQNYQDYYGTKPTSLWDYVKFANQARAGVGFTPAPKTTLAPDNWSKLPGNAAGTDYWRGGLTWINENGPELINLPSGSQIIPNHKLGDMVPSKGGGTTISFAKGAIVVNAAPGQSEEDIADAVVRKLGAKTRTYNLSRSMGANRLVFG